MPRTNPYEQLFVQLQFERSGLFKLVQKLLPIKSAFYPCCSFHITPSFFFETVYYVDKSDTVADFFAKEETVNEIIQSRSEVSKSNWGFFQLNLEDSLDEIPEVDLVIALNGGNVLKNAFEKAKKKGHVLTASEFSGEGFIKSDTRFGHLFDIGFQSGEYRTLKEERKQKKKGKAFTKDSVFRDTLEYSLYQRLR